LRFVEVYYFEITNEGPININEGFTVCLWISNPMLINRKQLMNPEILDEEIINESDHATRSVFLNWVSIMILWAGVASCYYP